MKRKKLNETDIDLDFSLTFLLRSNGNFLGGVINDHNVNFMQQKHFVGDQVGPGKERAMALQMVTTQFMGPVHHLGVVKSS